MKTSSSGLAKVQHLYVLQVELWNILSSELRTDAQRKEAQQRIKEFGSLLKEVDQKYMGGEDVYESLLHMHQEVNNKLKKKKGRSMTPKRSVRAKAPSKKAIKKKK